MSIRPPLLALVGLVGACAVGGAPTPVTVGRTAQRSSTDQLLIAVHPVSEQVVWASGARGTFLRTSDGGATWTAGRVPGADSLQFRDVHALDARTAWLLSIGNGPMSRIYRTDDGGASWTRQFTMREPEGFLDCLAFWDGQRGVAIGDAIGTAMTVLLTGDGGASWTRVPPATLPPAAPGEGSFAASGTCVTTGPEGRAWIVMNTPARSRMLRTADYGRTWALETLPITTHEGSGAQSVTFRDARHGMVIAGGYGVKPGDTLIAVTSDGGDTWVPRAAPAFAVGSWGGVYLPGAGTPTVVVAGPSGSAYSRDEGVTWTPLDTLDYWSVGARGRTAWAVGTRGKVTRLDGW